MSEEREQVEETAEEETTLDETLDEGQEESEGAEEGVEEEEGQEAEETDDDGVPLKNRIAEQMRKIAEPLQRKVAELEAQQGVYKDLISNLNKTKESESAKESITSIADEVFAQVNIDAATAKVLRQSQYIEAKRAIADRLAEADRQNEEVKQTNQEFLNNRIGAVKDAQSALSGEFGNLVVDDGQGGIRYDGDSVLFKRAKEIFERSATLQQQASGPAIAAERAERELLREKYGKKTTKKSTGERMKGGGVQRGGGTSKSVKVGGKFHRILTDAEWDKLPRDEMDEYDKWETLNRLNTSS